MKAIALVILFLLQGFSFALYGQELKIYSLDRFIKSTEDTAGFTSLTDEYIFNDHPDSMVIAEEYLGDASYENQNYHVLGSEYRARFFNDIGVSETDSIFIYNFSLDTVVSYRVADVPLIAFLSIYVHEPPFRQSDYMIGFDLGRTGIEHAGDYYSTLVNVGKENSFLTGNSQPILWERVDSTVFPKNTADAKHAEWYESYVRGKVYKFSTKGLDYFIQTLTDTSNKGYKSRARHLAVVDSKKGKIAFNKLYWEGESATLLPLNNNVENDSWGESWSDITLQWTGEVFKNKPAVILGFQRHSFGCPYIDFISLTESPIVIRCDNRH